LAAQLKKQRDILLDIHDSALHFLMEQGYDPAYGARPMKRAIQNFLAKPLAESMLAEGIDSGDSIQAYYNGAKIAFRRLGDDVFDTADDVTAPFQDPDDSDYMDDRNERNTDSGDDIRTSITRKRTGAPTSECLSKETRDALPDLETGKVGRKPLTSPGLQCNPILKERNEAQKIEGIAPGKGALSRLRENPDYLDPEDFTDTRKR
jgi:hypothetical protein